MERRWSAWLSALCLLFASWIAIAFLSLRLAPGAEIAAVLFPPWWSARQAIAAAASADAAIIRTGIIPAILVVEITKQNGLARLHDAGAWFAVDPQALGGCLVK